MARRPLNKRYKLMLRWGVPCVVIGLLLGWVAVIGANREDPSAPNADGSIEGLTSVLTRDLPAEEVRFRIADATEKAGIDFRHFPATRASLLPEDMGSGLAWGDYDDDGDPDLFVVNFMGSIAGEPDDDAAGRCALYENDGAGGFEDVAGSVGLELAVFGLAAAWADYDGDGDLDLYVTCYGPNRLLRNDDGRFIDVSEDAGVADDRFGAGCTWGDYDADGDLDLYVCNYVHFELGEADRARPTQQYGSEIPVTLNPSSYTAEVNVLYRNDGGGTFTDVAAAAGVENPTGRSLGAVWFDFDNDLDLDLYVANDVSDNGVFRNRGDGTFEDIGAPSLAADYRGAMGLAVGDPDHDDDLDLFVTHWIAQENAYFENMISEQWSDVDGSIRLFFMDAADLMGLGQLSLKMSGWATGFVDIDNDGYLDLWVVNGNTMQKPDDNTQLEPQRMHVFWHRPDQGYYEVGRFVCPALEEPFVGRGGAHADYDGDGDVDIAVVRHGGALALLETIAPADNHWLTVRLRRPGANSRALGARVTVRTDELMQTTQVGADGSYLSQHDGDLHFGLGEAETVDEIVITWPDGTTERHADVAADRIVTFRQE